MITQKIQCHRARTQTGDRFAKLTSCLPLPNIEHKVNRLVQLFTLFTVIAVGCCSNQNFSTKELLLKPSVTQSRKAKSEQIKTKGPHHPPTRDSSIRVDGSQKAQCTEEDNVNTQSSARVQDSSGSRIPPGPGKKRPHTCGGPLQDTREVQPGRAKTCGPVGPRRAPTHSADILKATKRVAGFATSAAEGESRPMRGLNHPESCMRSGSSFPRISPDGSSTEPTGPGRLTATRLQDCGCQEGAHTEGQGKRKSRVHK